MINRNGEARTERARTASVLWASHPHPALILLITVGVVCAGVGCRKLTKVTYPQAELTAKLAQTAKAEYGLDIQAQVVGNTLGVLASLDGLVDQALERNSKAFSTLGDLLFLLTRASLSTDAPLRFFILTVRDPKYPDLEMLFTRYTQDVKLLYFEDISRGEFFRRMLVEVGVAGERTPIDLSEAGLLKLFALVSSAASPRRAPIPVGDPWQAEEVHLPQFIAQLAARQIKHALEEHRSLRKAFTVEHVEGTFREGIFQVTLKMRQTLTFEPPRDRSAALTLQDGLLPWLVQRTTRALQRLLPPPRPPAPRTIEQDVLPHTAAEVTRLIRRYRFRNFQAVRIHEELSGRSLTIPYHDVLKPKPLLGFLGGW